MTPWNSYERAWAFLCYKHCWNVTKNINVRWRSLKSVPSLVHRAKWLTLHQMRLPRVKVNQVENSGHFQNNILKISSAPSALDIFRWLFQSYVTLRRQENVCKSMLYQNRLLETVLYNFIHVYSSSQNASKIDNLGLTEEIMPSLITCCKISSSHWDQESQNQKCNKGQLAHKSSN